MDKQTDIARVPDVMLIARKSLHGELVSILRDLILEGDLKPGDKVPEQALCEKFGVSRTPMREATKVLASEGLVDLLPSRGAIVARITSEEIEQLFPIMGALEGLAGELACQKITESELMNLQSMHKEMVDFYDRHEYAGYAKLNRAIHERFFHIADNSVLTGYFQNLIVRTHAIRFTARKSPERWREAVDDHEQMMSALAERNGKALGEILREHLRHKIGMVNEALEILPNKPGPKTPQIA
jgi:DNA-binding GntR family transcriptional regulator